ncbi:Leucine-rich repeat-containing protein 71 [Triplophysa tibetana]|uniref:Leucine-rich repeat-containing protein 71 n=1 Tax=Triplophysa tibetana TaxID=1572043 RepID=A0A5A9NJD6_9TELE|nr:Leucine-rich repeat-containing protein 71 [Triplophysa tibetana]
MKKRGDKSAKEKVDKVDSGIEEDPPKTADDYQCSGNLELDLQELCKLVGMREIPAVKTKQTEKEPPPDRGVMEESQTQTISESQKSMWSSKPCLQIELEDEDYHSTKEVKISGWMVDKQMLQYVAKRLDRLHVHFTEEHHLSVLKSQVLGPFALTHEEIVERRKLLMKGEESTLIQPSQVSLTDSTSEAPLSVHSSSSLDRTINNKSVKKKDNVKKEEKPTPGQATKKEEPKLAKKDSKVARGQTGKLSSKEKNLIVSESETFAQETVEVTEVVVPMLDSEIQHTGGKVIYPGNSCLVSLNLSGNKLTEQSLQLFLSSLTSQGDGGLQRLTLNRNRFSPECDTFLKIQELLSPKDSFNKNSSGQVEDEEQVEAQTTGGT